MPVRLRLGGSSGEKRIKKTRISGLAGFNWVTRSIHRRRCRTDGIFSESDLQSGRVFDLLPESVKKKKKSPADVNWCTGDEALSDATGLASCTLKIVFLPVRCATYFWPAVRFCAYPLVFRIKS